MPENNDPMQIIGDELQNFVERIEQHESEKKAISKDLKGVYAEAKGRGYDTKVLRRLIADRRRKPEDLAEEESLLAIYKDALGMGGDE